MKGEPQTQITNGVRTVANGAPDVLETKDTPPAAAGQQAKGGQPVGGGSKVIAPGDVARKLKQDYARARKESGVRGLDSLHGLIKLLMEEELDINEILTATAKTIYSQLNIKEVSMGLRSPDGLYRYVAMYGLRSEVWAAHQKLTYTAEQLLDPKVYKWTDISYHTKLFLAEDNTYTKDEASTRAEHLSMKSKRKTEEDSIEGDYMDILIYGPKDEILGWIETSGTWHGKIPDSRTIRSLEVISSVLALVLVRLRQKQV
jgi:hypothetical protein